MRLLGDRRSGGVETRTALEDVGQPVLQLHRIGGDQTHAARAVRDAPRLRVRQPLRPFPRGRRLPSGGDRDDQVLGRVQRGEAGRDRSGGAAHGAGFATDRHVVEGAQRDRHRQALERAVRGQETLHGPGGQRLQLVDRSGLRCDQGVARPCGPRPTRTCPKSSSPVRRSHTRLPSATRAHSCSGEGCR